jgi:hypothetical protein
METNLLSQAAPVRDDRAYPAPWPSVASFSPAPPAKRPDPPQSPARSPSDDTRDLLIGFALGMLGGIAFGAFVSWWYRVDSLATASILVLHAGFAGVAMGGWLFPTLRSP